mmetsp:Transcript_12998/g.32851  ORF Transcript_12998/g.32851 Transcript_12998/m.32851 type:complete len:113 (+) Transcript_12998:308-646(+)
MEAAGQAPSRPSKEEAGGNGAAAKAAQGPPSGPLAPAPRQPAQELPTPQQPPGTVVFHPPGCACGIHAMPSLFSMAALRKKKVPTDSETNKAGRNTAGDKFLANLSERDRFA